MKTANFLEICTLLKAICATILKWNFKETYEYLHFTVFNQFWIHNYIVYFAKQIYFGQTLLGMRFWHYWHILRAEGKLQMKNPAKKRFLKPFQLIT